MDEAARIAYFRADQPPHEWLDWAADLIWPEEDFDEAGVRRLAEHGIGARPLLFLDVDGTLLPFGSPARPVDDETNPLLAGLDPDHGRRLAALPSTWSGPRPGWPKQTRYSPHGWACLSCPPSTGQTKMTTTAGCTGRHATWLQSCHHRWHPDRTDRCRAPGPTAGVELWWSGKHDTHGGNIQVVAVPDGWPIWTSQVRPGRERHYRSARPGTDPARDGRGRWRSSLGLRTKAIRVLSQASRSCSYTARCSQGRAGAACRPT